MIRKATREDLVSCSKLIQYVLGEINSRYYSSEIIKKWQDYSSIPNLENKIKNCDFILYEEQDNIVGTGMLEEAHIGRLYVHPNYQRRGIGTMLMRVLEQIAKQRGIIVCDLNSTSNAINFYKSLGYEIIGPITMEQDGLSVTFTKMTKKL